MAYAVTEADDDAARVEKTQVKFLGLNVDKLRAVKANLTGVEGRFIDEMDTQINVLGQMPPAVHVTTLKAMAWKYRRLMPATIAPKLPPHDPIVQEMENAK
jgi:hypothetical protein